MQVAHFIVPFKASFFVRKQLSQSW